MKVIELLNLVYEKKAPKKMLYKYCEYEFIPEANDYQNRDGLALFEYLFKYERKALELEVEIIEEIEKPKEIGPLNKMTFEEFKMMNNQERFEATIKEYDKINEMRYVVNYLLEKSDKDE